MGCFCYSPSLKDQGKGVERWEESEVVDDLKETAFSGKMGLRRVDEQRLRQHTQNLKQPQNNKSLNMEEEKYAQNLTPGQDCHKS